jgi:hypothetical protein
MISTLIKESSPKLLKSPQKNLEIKLQALQPILLKEFKKVQLKESLLEFNNKKDKEDWIGFLNNHKSKLIKYIIQLI